MKEEEVYEVQKKQDDVEGNKRKKKRKWRKRTLRKTIMH